LTRPVHRQLLLKRALKLTSYPGVQGFFVDDLDVYCGDPHRIKSLILLFDELDEHLPVDFKYIYNRGFAFWSRSSHRLAAIVLENIGPLALTQTNRPENAWLEQRLKLHLPLLRQKLPDISIFYLDLFAFFSFLLKITPNYLSIRTLLTRDKSPFQ